MLVAVFERFTERSRRVIVLAQEEARILNHNYIGTEHLLLGLIHEGEGVAAKALESLGISLEAVRAQAEGIIGQGQQATSGHIPFTPRAKKVLELSFREAHDRGHGAIGTGDILLGLVREGEGVAAQMLVRLGAELKTVRHMVLSVEGTFSEGVPVGSDELLTEEPVEGFEVPWVIGTAGPYELERRLDRIEGALVDLRAKVDQILRRLDGGDERGLSDWQNG